MRSKSADLRHHAADFEAPTGFTFTVLDPANDDVIGCVYLYPANSDNYEVSVRSWVRADRKRLDAPLADSLAAWIDDRWPWQRLDRRGR